MVAQTKHRFNVKEYYRMAETGVLRPDARVELLDGEIIDLSPIGPAHAGMVKRSIRIFTQFAKGRHAISAHDPLRLDDHSEPQPDFMLLKPGPDDYFSRHPEPDDVFLVIEVADASLDFDREEKVPAYGRAGIAEVWIVNLKSRPLRSVASQTSPAMASKVFCARATMSRRWPFPTPEWTWRKC